jgi:hypothetical protein
LGSYFVEKKGEKQRLEKKREKNWTRGFSPFGKPADVTLPGDSKLILD